MTSDTHAWGEVSGELALPLAEGLIAWEPHLVFPGLEPGRGARPPHARSRAGRHPRGRRHPAGGGAGCRALLAARRLRRAPSPERWTRRAGAGRGPRGRGLPAAHADRRERARAGVQRPPRRPAQRPARRRAGGRGGRRRGQRAREGQPIPGKPVNTTSTPTSRRRRSSRWATSSAASRRSTRATARCSRWRESPSRRPSPRAPPSRSSPPSPALEDGLVAPSDDFPVETAAVIEGREVANAHDEPCGGTFTQSFAKSCNSVFAPLGVEVGAERLVDEAEQFGFNAARRSTTHEATAAVDPPASTIPRQEIGGDLDVGVSAIGQGEVLATPLQLASVSQTVAARRHAQPDRRSPRTPSFGPTPSRFDVMPPKTAQTLRELMIGSSPRAPARRRPFPASRSRARRAPPSWARRRSRRARSWRPARSPSRRWTPGSPPSPPPPHPRLAVAAMVVNADGDGGVVAAPDRPRGARRRALSRPSLLVLAQREADRGPHDDEHAADDGDQAADGLAELARPPPRRSRRAAPIASSAHQPPPPASRAGAVSTAAERDHHEAADLDRRRRRG